MYHVDTMEIILTNGNKIYQISTEDDYSREYVGLQVFKSKHAYFVIISLLRAFRLHSKPSTFHRDNGGEYKNGAVKRLLEMLDIVEVPTRVMNPKGNGKKERSHRQDRKYFYEKNNFQNIESVEQKIPEYLEFRNEIKGQWARYGQTASAAAAYGERNPMTDEELHEVVRELYFVKGKRQVKKNGKVKFWGKWYHVCKEMYGKCIELRITLRGMEAWYEGRYLKRWNHWKEIIGYDAEYILEKYLL